MSFVDVTLKNDDYVQHFVNNFDRIYFLTQNVRNVTLPYFEQISAQVNLTKQCSQMLRIVFDHPEYEWSALMLDANGRLIRPGFLSGTITDFGDYDQCLAINHQDPKIPETRIYGRYCLMSIRLPIPPANIKLNFKQTSYENRWPSKWFRDPQYRFYYRLVNGVCFPSQCQPNEIESLARKAFERFHLNIGIEACQSQLEITSMDFAQQFSISILSICFLMVVISTIIDWNFGYNKQNSMNNISGVRKFCNALNLIKNTQTLFSIHEYNDESIELTPIHGLRFMMIMWVVICHTSNFAPLGLYDQPMIASHFAERIHKIREFWSQFVVSGSLSVQSFFIISGLISLHTAFKNQSFLKSITYWKYIFLRWIRFAPPLLGMFCFQFLWPRLGSGPMMHWEYLRYGHQPCYELWWANFLFISNWFKLVDQCGSHTWYLSADFQINILAYFLIRLYVCNYNAGLWLNIVSLIVASVIPTIINWYHNVPLIHILMESDIEKLINAFNMIEFNTYNHYAAYLAGLLVAALLHDRKFYVNKKNKIILWWISMIFILVLPFSTYPFLQLDEIPSTFLPMIYTGLKRSIWIAAISWIIYASCSVSKNCIIAKFLSAKIFQPFSRLTFCIYLTQSLVIWHYAYQSRELHTISHYNSNRVNPKNRAVFITGCDSGFGYYLAENLKQKGYYIFAGCLSLNSDGAIKLKQKNNRNDRVLVIELDVTSDDIVKQACKEIENFLSKHPNVSLWAVVNNAGIMSLSEIEFGDMTTFRRQMEVNGMGVVRVTKQMLPLLRHNHFGSGRVINMASLAGRFTMPGFVAYCLSKSVVIAFSDGLRRELSKWNIDVISIEPHLYKTNLLNRQRMMTEFESQWSQTEESIQKDYGRTYHEGFIKTMLTVMDTARNEIEQVVSTMEQAVTLSQVEYYYTVAHMSEKIRLWFWSTVAPVSMIDFFMRKFLTDCYGPPKMLIDEEYTEISKKK